jgi:hypothetical protein
MIYKFSAATEHSLANLESGTFYCRHLDYNDPFEQWWKLESGMPDVDDMMKDLKKLLLHGDSLVQRNEIYPQMMICLKIISEVLRSQLHLLFLTRLESPVFRQKEIIF